MFSWLMGICGRLFRQTDHESGPNVSAGGAMHPAADYRVETGSLTAIAAVINDNILAFVPPVAPRRAPSTFMLAARLASVSKLNMPSERAPTQKRRTSSTKPTPKAKLATVSPGSKLKFKGSAKAHAATARTAEVIRFVPKGKVQAARLALAA